MRFSSQGLTTETSAHHVMAQKVEYVENSRQNVCLISAGAVSRTDVITNNGHVTTF
jgi:hypothetical protein